MNIKIDVYKILGTTKAAIKKDYNNFCNDFNYNPKYISTKKQYLHNVFNYKIKMYGMQILQGYDIEILKSILLNDL